MDEAKITVTACVICRNNDRELAGCLDSLRSVSDEIIVVNTGSDNSINNAAAQGGARVIKHPFEGDYSAIRNIAVDAAKGEWILMLDPHERLEWDHYDKFRTYLRNKDRLGYVITRVQDKYQGASSTELKLCLFRNIPEIRYTGLVYERIDPSIAAIASDFEKAVGRHPARIYASQLTDDGMLNHDNERSLDLLQKQIKVDPEDPYYWYRFAIHPYVMKRFINKKEDALKNAWNLLRMLDPKGNVYSYTPEVAAHHIMYLLKKADITSAFTISSEAGELTWFSPYLHYTLALCAIAAGKLPSASAHLEGAMEDSRSVLTCSPIEGVTDSLSLNALSEVRYMEGDEEESKRLYAKAIDLSNNKVANSFYGDPKILVQNGYYMLALVFLKKAAQLAPHNTFPWVRGSEILISVGEYKKSLEWLRIAMIRASDKDRGRIADRLNEAEISLYA